MSPFGVGVSYCSACLWSGGLQPAVGVERRRPGHFPACFCGRDGSVPSHPICSRLCGAVPTLRNGFVHPKLAWRGAQELGQQSSGQGPAHGWWRGDLLWLVKPGWCLVPSPLCPPGVFFGWYTGPGGVRALCLLLWSTKTDPVPLRSLPDSKGSLEPHKPGECPAGTAASAHPLNTCN